MAISNRIKALSMAAVPAALVLQLVSCAAPQATLTPPPPPVAVAAPAPPPPAPPPPPPVTVSNGVIELASAFRAAMSTAASISPNFTDGASVSRAVRIGSSYEQVQLQQGAVAYATIAALQEPNFVASVRKYVVDRTTREEMVRRIIENPNEVLGMENVDKAAGLAIGVLDQMGANVMVAGVNVKQAAYGVQAFSWSKVNVSDAAQRLSDSKTLSKVRVAGAADDIAALKRATAGEAALSLAGPPVAGPYTPLITRALALAALSALGATGDENFDTVVQPLLVEKDSAFCLELAKLTLYECLSVSRPYYEDIFCVGEHAMRDTGQCVIKAVNSPTPAYVEPPPPPRPAPRPAARPAARPPAKK